jgi:hypothetical protein
MNDDLREDEMEDGGEEDSDAMAIDDVDDDAADDDDDDDGDGAEVEVNVWDPLGRRQLLSPEEGFAELCTALQRNDPGKPVCIIPMTFQTTALVWVALWLETRTLRN